MKISGNGNVDRYVKGDGSTIICCSEKSRRSLRDTRHRTPRTATKRRRVTPHPILPESGRRRRKLMIKCRKIVSNAPLQRDEFERLDISLLPEYSATHHASLYQFCASSRNPARRFWGTSVPKSFPIRTLHWIFRILIHSFGGIGHRWLSFDACEVVELENDDDDDH